MSIQHEGSTNSVRESVHHKIGNSRVNISCHQIVCVSEQSVGREGACAGRIFPTTLLSHAQVAAAFSRMLPDAPECFPSWYQYLWPQDGHLSFWPSGPLAYWIPNGLDRYRRRGCSKSTSYKLSREIFQCTSLRFAAEMLRRRPGTRLELLTRISSIRFCFLFCTSGRMNDRRDSGN